MGCQRVSGKIGARVKSHMGLSLNYKENRGNGRSMPTSRRSNVHADNMAVEIYVLGDNEVCIANIVVGNQNNVKIDCRISDF